MVSTFAPDGYFREPIGPHDIHRGTAELRSFFTRCFSAGGGIGLQHCTVTDDGVRCALEYNCVRWGSHDLRPRRDSVSTNAARTDCWPRPASTTTSRHPSSGLSRGARSVAGGLAAVDVQDLAGDERRGLQEEDAVDDVADLAHAPERVERRRARRSVSAGCTGVWMMPGETALTRMPREAYSMARDLVAAARPPLVSAASTDGALELACSARVVGDVDDVAAAPLDHLGDGALGDRKKPARLTPMTSA